MKEIPVSTSRSGRIVRRKSFDDFQYFEDSPERSSTREVKKTSLNVKSIRRFQQTCENNPKRKRKLCDIPEEYEKLKQKTDAGVIPETVYYRATGNSMYIPTITADMIQDDGKSLTVQTSSDDYFKYARVRQTTKNEHADPRKVFQIIEAVRQRPIIWDQRLVCHENLPLIRRAWQQIDIELGIDEEYPLARRKQIWKSKKDYYSFAFNSDALSKWIFSNAMEFYQPMVNFRTTVCLRPTVSSPDSVSSTATNLYEKVVLADKNIKCAPSDKTNVLTFLLKSLHEAGMTNSEMMEKHGVKILEIFQKNLKNIPRLMHSNDSVSKNKDDSH